MSDQPKPTTGEWTHGMAVVQDGVPIPIPYVAVDMHNASLAEAWKDGFLKDKSDMLEAALASERELGQQECNRLDAFWQNELARQLASERELRERITLSWTLSKSDNEQLRSQLAAELDKRTNLAAFLDGSERKLAELRRTQTTLVDALKLIAWSSEMILPSKVAKDALAKVKEGK